MEATMELAPKRVGKWHNIAIGKKAKYVRHHELWGLCFIMKNRPFVWRCILSLVGQVRKLIFNDMASLFMYVKTSIKEFGWLWPRAKSHMCSAGPRPSHASFTARSSCPLLHGNSSSLGTNVIVLGQIYKYSSWHHFIISKLIDGFPSHAKGA